MTDTQSRRFQLTINNPLPQFSHDEIKRIASLSFKTFEYLALADEKVKEGTFHTHVFICFKSSVRFSTIKKQFPTAHIEKCKGSVKENIDYIKKQGKWADTDKSMTSVEFSFEELGEKPKENQGDSAFYDTMYRLVIEEQLSLGEILQLNHDYVKEIDTITRLRTALLIEKYKGTRRTDLKVTFIQGKTGCGKSRGILDEFGDENVYRVTDYTHPFDNYEMQDVIVFEEFRSSLPIADILCYCDIYPITLKARYSNKFACYNHVFFATNLPLEQQYQDIQRSNPESWQAFLRRIKKVRVYYDLEKYIDYPSVDAYFHRNDNRFVQIDELPMEVQQELPFK